jgi:hypothetical protein
MGTMSDCLHLTVNLKNKNYLDVNSDTQRCPNKIFKTFLIEDFFHLLLVVHLELGIHLRKFSKKIRNDPNKMTQGFVEKT